MEYFDHEKLDVYQQALEFVADVNMTTPGIPRGYSYVKTQLQRAALSVVLNIAEGSGEMKGDEKARYYRMAKRSATESAAVLDVLVRLDLVTARELEEVRARLIRIVSMLTRMVQVVMEWGRDKEGGKRRKGEGAQTQSDTQSGTQSQTQSGTQSQTQSDTQSDTQSGTERQRRGKGKGENKTTGG